MDRETAGETVKGYLEDYLRGKGIDTRKPFRCLNPEHADKHPSMSYKRDGKNCYCKCFSCGAKYSLIDLIGIDYGLTDVGEMFKKAYELYNIDIDAPRSADPKPQKEEKGAEDFTAYYKKAAAARSEAPAQEYLKKRCISEGLASKFWLGYDAEYRTFNVDDSGQTSFATWRALIIPTGKGSYVARNIDEPQEPAKKNRYRKKGHSLIFNSKCLYKADRPLFVTEGEIDALSIMEVGGLAIGLGSKANYTQLVSMLEKQKPAQPLILSLDADPEGQETEGKLAEELTRLQIPFYRYNIFGAAKDANEALIIDRKGFEEEVRAAEHARETELEAMAEATKAEYLKTSAAANLAGFMDGIKASVNTPAISTGFLSLDYALDGGLYEGLYIVGAISSLGKTTLCLQIADNLAGEGRDVLIFSLEMSRTELMAKSISRHSFLLADNKKNAKTTRGITAGARWEGYSEAEKALINKAISAYKGYADHIFIHEGIGDIGVTKVREIVEQHISLTGNKPIIVIDYVQILSSYVDEKHPNRSLTDKQSMDKNIVELKRISRDYHIPLIGISSFNRDSYRTKGSTNQGRVSMTDFKESGSIEYSADVLLGLEFSGAGTADYDEREEKRKNPREIRLIVLKNRNGKAWEEANFVYYPLFNCFQEAEGEFEDSEIDNDVFKNFKEWQKTK